MAKKRKKLTPEQRYAAEARRRAAARQRIAIREATPKGGLSPAAARELLFRKMRDMYWLQEKWDAPATSRRIDRMTDQQVFAALGLNEDQHESAVRETPSKSRWASKDDPTHNVLWYHGGEKEAA